MSKEKKKAYLDITTEPNDGPYRYMRARIIGDDGYPDFWDFRRGFSFSARTNAEHLSGEKAIKMYGHALTISSYEYVLRELKDGVKCIESVQKKMGKMDEKYGPPASFGAWVQRVATALGVDAVKVNGEYVRVMQTAWRIDLIIEEWKKELCPKVEG